MRFSENGPRGRPAGRKRAGQALIFSAVALTGAIAIAGLALDLGRMYAVRARLASAVDGGALAGARVLPRGEVFAENTAMNFAGMNFAPGFMGTSGHSFSVSFIPNPAEPRIQVQGNAVMPTTLMRLVGISQVNVSAEAEATRRPLRLPLVLDTSLSMSRGNAIAALRSGAIQFVDFFDDTMDMMALVRFASGRLTLFHLGYHFKTPMITAISGFTALGNTTAGHALNAARDELAGEANPTAFRAIIFFTDGRPTSFRDIFTIDGNPLDAVIGGYQNPNDHGGDPPEKGLQDPYRIHEWLGIPNPDFLPDGREANNWNILDAAREQTRVAAESARESGIAIFVIALGSPGEDEWHQPDVPLLVELANVPYADDPLHPGETIVNENYDPDEPQGAFFFTPDANELENVFHRLAREIAVRLTR
ncbi:MAG: VWA domain-containing protein [Candidatus Eisenbacteria bacterium]